MQRIVDRSETTAGRKRRPQMFAILIEIGIIINDAPDPRKAGAVK